MKVSRFKRKRISESNPCVYLPNHVIDRIFSFLPMKDVVSYSVIAKPFLDSWLYARNLCFDMLFKVNCSLSGREEIPIIDHIINSHRGKKIDSFKIYIPMTPVYTIFLRKWMKVVASKGVEELELHLDRYVNGTVYHMEIDSINIDTLRTLKLICCPLSQSFNLKNLQFLKSLTLTRVRVLPLLITNLFINCVVLESLELEYCFSTDGLMIEGSNTFRTLSIRGCGDISLINVDNSSITTFHYDGEIEKIKIIHPMIPNDVILNLAATTGWPQHISERPDLTEVLRNARTLSINNVVLEGLSPKYMYFEYNDVGYYLSNLKELQLVRYGISFVNPWDIISFVKNCPQIERLFLDLGDYAMEAGSYWNSVAKEKFENCQIEFPHLKLLKVKGFKTFDLEEKLVNFFLLRAKSLESVIILLKNNYQEIRLSDVVIASKVASISTYSQHDDQSCVFPKHRIFL